MYTAAAMLLSRQPLRPTRQTPWVRQTYAAVCWARNTGATVVSSVGLQTYDLVTAAASLEQTPLRLVVPITAGTTLEATSRDLAYRFDLKPNSTEFIPVVLPSAGSDKASSLSRRDRAVVHLADVVVPIAVRPSGNMHGLVELARSSGKSVMDRFAIPTPENPVRLVQDFSGLRLRSGVDEAARGMIIHWTRGSSDTWPDEREIDLWQAVLASACWPRDGFATLRHILERAVLLASPRHMPDHRPCVCFSALPPSAALPLMRWRTRYHEMTFEPYGVGIHRDAAVTLGITPVTYISEEEPPPADLAERWRYQSAGRIGDWRAEAEWRFNGNVELSRVPAEAIRVFCRTEDETARLRESVPFDIVPLFA